MGMAYIPSQTFTNIGVGTTSISDPVLLLTVDGIVYPNGYRINYNSGFRNFYPSYESGNLFISCHAVAYGEDLPELTISENRLEILIVSS